MWYISALLPLSAHSWCTYWREHTYEVLTQSKGNMLEKVPPRERFEKCVFVQLHSGGKCSLKPQTHMLQIKGNIYIFLSFYHVLKTKKDLVYRRKTEAPDAEM